MTGRPYLVRYLIGPQPATHQEQDHPYHKPTRIFYQSAKTSNTDQGHLSWFSRCIQGFQKDQMLDIMWTYLGRDEWRAGEYYDVVNPFGDARQKRIHSVWVFDTVNDILLFMNRERRASIPLAVLRERPVTIDDMRVLGPSVPPLPVPRLDLSSSSSPLPGWKPQIQLDERLRAFTHRILRDFNHQWRHLFRSTYNDVTLRVLGRAIIRLAALDFDVRKQKDWRFSSGYYFVWISKLPKWKPFDTKLVRIGSMYLVLCQSIEEGLSVANAHVVAREDEVHRPGDSCSSPNIVDYMILSIKEIMLCYITPTGTLSYTSPERFFNGNYNTGPPSDLALDYLIWGLSLATPRLPAPRLLLALPIEIQDFILHHVSASTVTTAKLGCVLGIGSPFLWKDGPLEVGLEETWAELLPSMPIESVIHFDEEGPSGLVYRGRDAESRAENRLWLMDEDST